MNDELRNALAVYLQNQATKQGGGAGNFMTEGPQGPNLPQLSLQDRNAPNPAISAQYGIPVGDGELTARGNLFKPDAQAPANWGAMLGYSKPF